MGRPRPNGEARLTAADTESIGLKFDCGVEVTLSAARSGLAAPTEVPQQVQLESAATVKLHGERRSQKKAEVALRRERRFDRYSHLSHVKLGKDHAIYTRHAPGAKDVAKPVLKLERHSNLSEVSDLDAEVESEAAAAVVAGNLEEDMSVTFEPASGAEAGVAETLSFALPPPNFLDTVFPLPPSLQSSPRFGPSAPPVAALTEALTNLQHLAATLAAEATDKVTLTVEATGEEAADKEAAEQATETAEARADSAVEEAALDGWVLISPAQLPHSHGLAEGGGVAQLRPTSLLHTSMLKAAS